METMGGLLRGQIALSFCKELIANHELLYGRGSQKWGIEMRVQLPVWRFAAGRLRTVPAHRIREGRFEQVVVPNEQSARNIRQAVAFCCIQVRQMMYVATWNQKRFKRPNCPKRHKDHPMLVL